MKLSALIRNLIMGQESTGNYTCVEQATGFLCSKGSAISYRDEYPNILVPASGAAAPDSVGATIGGVARQLYSFDGGSIQEVLSGSFEIPHDMVIDSAQKALGYLPEFHVHWRPSTTGTGVVKWFIDWEWSPAQGAPAAQTTLSLTYNITTNKQYHHLINTFGTLPNLAFGIGDKIGFNIRRTPSDAADTYAGDVLLEQVAMHIPCDTHGSRQIYVK